MQPLESHVKQSTMTNDACGGGILIDYAAVEFM